MKSWILEEASKTKIHIKNRRPPLQFLMEDNERMHLMSSLKLTR